MAFAGRGVSGWDLFPGHGPQLTVQAGLVALGDEDVVRAEPAQVAGVGTVGVKCVGGDDRAGDVQAIQQRGKSVDLIGLCVHRGLSQDSAGLLVQSSEQVHRAAIVAAGAAGGLAVQGDDCRSARAIEQVVSQADRAWPSTSGSNFCRVRRIVDSLGATRPIPNFARPAGVRS